MGESAVKVGRAERVAAVSQGDEQRDGLFSRAARFRAGWGGVSLVAVAVLAGSRLHGAGGYFEAWGAIGVVTLAPGLVLALQAARRTRGPARRFWLTWSAGLVPALLLAAGALERGVGMVSGATLPAGARAGVEQATADVLILVIVATWSAALVALVRGTAGSRAAAIDCLDVAIAVVVGLAPLLLLLVPALSDASARWFTVPATLAAIGSPAAAAGAALLFARAPSEDRRSELFGVVTAVVCSVDAWLQVLQGIDHFRLPAAPVLALHAASLVLLLSLPLHARRHLARLPGGRSPESGVRRWGAVPVVVAVAVPVLVLETMLRRGLEPWVVPYSLAVLAGIVLLALALHVLTVDETHRLYGEIERVSEERRQMLTDLVNAVEDDRHRVAAQLHQLSVESLAVLGSVQQASHRSLPPESAQLLSGALDGLRAEVAARAEGLRRLMLAIRAPVRGEAALATAISASMGQLYPGGPAPDLAIDIDPELCLDWTTSTIVYRIVQEALASVRARGLTTTVDVTVDAPAGHVVVMVVDDGGLSGPPAWIGDPSLETVRLFAELGRGVLEVEAEASRHVIRVTLGAGAGAGAGEVGRSSGERATERLAPAAAHRVPEPRLVLLPSAPPS